MQVCHGKKAQLTSSQCSAEGQDRFTRLGIKSERGERVRTGYVGALQPAYIIYG